MGRRSYTDRRLVGMTIRVPSYLMTRVRELADAEGISMNRFVLNKLKEIEPDTHEETDNE